MPPRDTSGRNPKPNLTRSTTVNLSWHFDLKSCVYLVIKCVNGSSPSGSEMQNYRFYSRLRGNIDLVASFRGARRSSSISFFDVFLHLFCVQQPRAIVSLLKKSAIKSCCHGSATDRAWDLIAVVIRASNYGSVQFLPRFSIRISRNPLSRGLLGGRIRKRSCL